MLEEYHYSFINQVPSLSDFCWKPITIKWLGSHVVALTLGVFCFLSLTLGVSLSSRASVMGSTPKLFKTDLRSSDRNP